MLKYLWRVVIATSSLRIRIPKVSHSDSACSIPAVHSAQAAISTSKRVRATWIASEFSSCGHTLFSNGHTLATLYLASGHLLVITRCCSIKAGQSGKLHKAVPNIFNPLSGNCHSQQPTKTGMISNTPSKLLCNYVSQPTAQTSSKLSIPQRPELSSSEPLRTDLHASDWGGRPIPVHDMKLTSDSVWWEKKMTKHLWTTSKRMKMPTRSRKILVRCHAPWPSLANFLPGQ